MSAALMLKRGAKKLASNLIKCQRNKISFQKLYQPIVFKNNFHSSLTSRNEKNETIKFSINSSSNTSPEESKDVKLNQGNTSIGQIPQQLMISFTCKKCDERSTHIMSKQAYTKGTVLIECPGCHNRHLIADHLKIFSDTRITIEDILSAKGEAVKIGNPNDIEFEKLPESIKKKLGIDK